MSENEVQLSMTTLKERRLREVRMFKSICVKLIMADVYIEDFKFDLESCKVLLFKLKDVIQDRLMPATEDDLNIVTKLFKSCRLPLMKIAVYNLFERTMTAEMITNLDVNITEPRNLADISWIAFKKINENYTSLQTDVEVKRTFIKKMIDDMEDFLCLHQKEYILADLNIIPDA
jgi:hypothetical protein